MWRCGSQICMWSACPACSQPACSWQKAEVAGLSRAEGMQLAELGGEEKEIRISFHPPALLNDDDFVQRQITQTSHPRM